MYRIQGRGTAESEIGQGQQDLELENPSNALECFSKFRSLSTVELQTLMDREDDGLEGELAELEEKGNLISFGCESGRIWHFIQQ